ncbi:cyclin-dependent kinase 4 isoform X2 [Synchiropus splendidus]|uniref:cyclin-dependent kinase 4 isoform X2 n=1 Tax=Synchiropus splendidus TaxID=270530 RepID=UPI00237EE50F|nr:cyclin-dependent kinase 4 isoform X2 [Synchiropus splendidus]
MASSPGRLEYELLALVGEGSYGHVYKAREVGGSRRLLAVKKFHVPHESFHMGIPASVIREVSLLRMLRDFNHPNIVKMLDVSSAPTGKSLHLILVLEFLDQDLSMYLSKVPADGLNKDCIQGLMVQLLCGLDFLHTNMVLHRDLKPANILVGSHGEVKIADFGLARIYTFNVALTPGVVTLWYRAPEVLLNSVYVSSVDMWSAGCIFAELFLLRPLFLGYTESQQLRKIFDVIGLPKQEDWPGDSPISYSPQWGTEGLCARILADSEADDLLFDFLTFKPSCRISAAKALTHSFFTHH